MPTVHIDGVGNVHLDDSFNDLPPEDQQKQIEEIAAQAGTNNATDGSGGGSPSVPPIDDAGAALRSLIPGIRITSQHRDGNDPLSKANPNSWHTRSNAAVDVSPMQGMTYAQMRQKILDAGYPLIEARDEVANPVPWATGPHYHFVLGQRSGDNNPGTVLADNTDSEGSGTSQGQPQQPNASRPNAPTMPDNVKAGITDMIDGGHSYEDIAKAYPGWADAGENPDRIKGWITYRSKGGREKVGFNNSGDQTPDSSGHMAEYSPLSSALIGAANGLDFNTAPKMAAAAATVIPGIGPDSMWTKGHTFSDAFTRNLARFDDKVHDAADENPASYFAGNIGSAFVPFGGGAKLGGFIKDGILAANGVNDAKLASNALRMGATTAEGAGVGAAYGAGGSDWSDPSQVGLDALKGAGLGGTLGAAGEGIIGTAIRATKAQRLARFLADQTSQPKAPFNAEIVNELGQIADQNAANAPGVKARAPVNVKQINALGDSYLTRFKSLIVATVDDPVQKQKLLQAIERRNVIPDEDIDALRDGSVEGDAAADAITKYQQLRALTPEIARDPSTIAKIGNAVATGLDYLPVPGVIGKGVRWASKSIPGDAEAARAHAAQGLINLRDAYAKLGEIVGPSGQADSSAALWQKYADIMDQSAGDGMDGEPSGPTGSVLDRAWRKYNRLQGNPTTPISPVTVYKQSDKAYDALSKLQQAQDAQKAAQMDEMFKSVEPVPVTKGQTNDEISGWNNILKNAQDRQAAQQAALKSSAPKLDFTPPKPAAAPKVAKVDPAQAAIDDAINNGIMGDSQTQQAFANRLGISVPDMLRTLDHIEPDVPDLSGEINRIRFNFPTKAKNMGAVLGPRMRAAMGDLGIQPTAQSASARTSIPVDEAAQARLAYVSPEPPAGAPYQKTLPPSTGPASAAPAAATPNARTTTGQPQLRAIDRPQQWAAGKDNYQSKANAVIHDLNNDPTLSNETMQVINRIPETIRDHFKNTQDATDYIENEVVPELESNHAPAQEISRVKSYLYEIAGHKPYATPEAYTAGTKYRSAGRPRSN